MARGCSRGRRPRLQRHADEPLGVPPLRSRERAGEGTPQRRQTPRLTPHPALRATFSRKREKGGRNRRPRLRATSMKRSARPLSRLRGKGWGEGTPHAAPPDAAAYPHPALRATFSRKREKGLSDRGYRDVPLNPVART